jgi:hypothetical protein
LHRIKERAERQGDPLKSEIRLPNTRLPNKEES